METWNQHGCMANQGTKIIRSMPKSEKEISKVKVLLLLVNIKLFKDNKKIKKNLVSSRQENKNMKMIRNKILEIHSQKRVIREGNNKI